jgi:hypothetical protein
MRLPIATVLCKKTGVALHNAFVLQAIVLLALAETEAGIVQACALQAPLF